MIYSFYPILSSINTRIIEFGTFVDLGGVLFVVELAEDHELVIDNIILSNSTLLDHYVFILLDSI